jgi:glutathione synthase/RimK-type ligase-like ATP-grasp enzyme
MRIAIHDTPGSFASKWIEYCEINDIDFAIVNCYDSDIMEQMKSFDILLWHHQQSNATDYFMAKKLLEALEFSGKIVFPNHNTNWHFDDKVAQKYLFEGLGIQAPENYVFYDLKSLKKFAKTSSYPIVWKLKGGSGSRNVKLVKSESDLVSIGKKMFGSGIREYDAIDGIKESVRRYKMGKKKMIDIFKALAHLVYPVKYERMSGKAWGYVYLQEFIPNNDSDYRVIVINDKAFAIKRYTRPNDFRASGSGYIEYKKELFDEELLKTSFDIASKVKTQCIAFDFVYRDGKPLLVEMSFGYRKEGYYACEGYWDSNLNWYPGSFNPYGWIIEDIKETFLNLKQSN